MLPLGVMLALVVVAAACVAPPAAAPSHSPTAAASPEGASPEPARTTIATTPPVVTVDTGDEAATLAEARLGRVKCTTAWHDTIGVPTRAQLAAADRAGPSANAAGGTIVGSAADAVSAYPDATLVAVTTDGRELAMITTLEGRLTALSLLAFPTPAGNLYWVPVAGSYASPCR